MSKGEKEEAELWKCSKWPNLSRGSIATVTAYGGVETKRAGSDGNMDNDSVGGSQEGNMTAAEPCPALQIEEEEDTIEIDGKEERWHGKSFAGRPDDGNAKIDGREEEKDLGCDIERTVATVGPKDDEDEDECLWLPEVFIFIGCGNDLWYLPLLVTVFEVVKSTNAHTNLDNFDKVCLIVFYQDGPFKGYTHNSINF